MPHTAAYKGLIYIPLSAAAAPPGGLSGWMDLFIYLFFLLYELDFWLRKHKTAARLSLPTSALRQLIEPQTSAPTPNLLTAFFLSPTNTGIAPVTNKRLCAATDVQISPSA